MNTKEVKEQLSNIINQSDERLLRMLLAVSKEYNEGLVSASSEKYSESYQLYRLVYTSARSARCDDAEIEKILEASRRNNAKLGVTGILIHTKDRFLQILEGERETVTTLYEKIEKDTRHGGSNMRFCEPVTTRYFRDWDMASKKMDSNKIEYNTSISENKRKLYHSMMDGDIHSYHDEGMRVLKTFLLFS